LVYVVVVVCLLGVFGDGHAAYGESWRMCRCQVATATVRLPLPCCHCHVATATAISQFLHILTIFCPFLPFFLPIFAYF
jgi:hypothetical protein